MENTQDYQDYQDYRAEILGIVRSNASPGIMRNKLEDYHENDLADVFPDLSVAERRKLCRILNLDMLADIFEYIDEKQAAEYLDEMDVRKAAAILSRMETDAVVDVLRMIPKEKRALLLELMDDEARKDMAVIAAFDDEEIGSRMTTNYIEIRENLTVKQAMTELVSQAAKNDNISTIFMVTADHTFYGAMDLKDLITARQDTRLEDLIVTSYPYVYGHELIDDCIEKLKDYSENSTPILDNDNKLLGVITSQSIVDLVDDEMGEDYAMFAGLTAEEDLKEPLKESMKKRLPWLLVLLALGTVVSSVVGVFEQVVSQLTIIMCFQSLILDIAGNVGTQSLAVTIRVLMDESLRDADRIFKWCDSWNFIIPRIRTLYCTFQRKDLDIRVCGIRLYRSVSDGGNGNFRCGGYTDSSVLQEDQYRPGGSVRTTYYNHQRPCCGSVLLRLELAVFDRVLPYGGLILTED